MADNEIIVTGNTTVVDVGNYAFPTGQQGAQATVSALSSTFYSKPHFSRDEEVEDNDIVVIGNRLKDNMLILYIYYTFPNQANGYSLSVNLPCIGATKHSEISSILMNLNFNATNVDYGEGRAGENLVGAGGGAVPVNINAEALRGYDLRTNGLNFLIAHEIAHGLKAMQEYDLAQWTAYINGPGLGLTLAQQKAQYPSSAQFAQNEARANTVARGILAQFGLSSIVPDPANGYQVC